MSNSANFAASNKADFIIDISATDVLSGDAIDFTGAEVCFVVKDESGCTKLTAIIDDGITQPDGETLEIAFTAEQMEALCPGSYHIGCVYSLNGVITQLLRGSVSIYDGIAEI